MDWRQLEYFRTVARLQHVTRAAERLGMTQPALSRAMTRLERELGLPLFQRTGRSIRLTRYGAAFLPRVERALTEVEEGRRELADLSGAAAGVVALGFLRTLGAEYVPQLVRRYRAGHPDVRFTFSQDNGSVLERELEAGELDLCFMPVPVDNPRLEVRHVADQELVLIVPPDHALAGRRSVRLRDVAEEPFVSFKAGHAMRKVVDDLCAAAGFAPQITFEGDESSSVRGFVAAGLGVAIVPIPGTTRGIALLRVAEPVARRSIGVVWVRDRYVSETVRVFREFVVASTDSTARSWLRLRA